MKLYRTPTGPVLESDGAFFRLHERWDPLINHPNLFEHLRAAAAYGKSEPRLDSEVLAPVLGQEVWAAGVTYLRSRAARMEESREAGGGSFYDRVYEAERPELFFKAAPWRVRGPGQHVRVRRDSKWTVPEPELAVCVNTRGEIVGYTIGNDVSARDIEGENPLYLPQAKTYDGSCALGPALLISEVPMPPDARISLKVIRSDDVVFEGSTTVSQMRRTPDELVEYLCRETSFPLGCVLLTGTGVVPPDEFTLASRDEVRIEIGGIGSLVNCVE
ncbi:MAG TPA: fumarylacetoacetate hydrolase family protein [Gemmatimonadaceae bacterium]